MTATFSEDVSDFIVGDIVVGNGTVADFVNVDNSEYTFNVILAGQGVVTVDINADVAVDAADNYNTAAVQFSIVYDSVAPTVNITAPQTNDYVNSTAVITFTDDELTNAQCSIDNTNWVAAISGVTTLSNLTGFNALGEVSFTLYLRDIDAAGNIGTDSEIGIIKDTSAPSVVISSGASDPTNTLPIPMTVLFSEDVSGFIVGDIVVGNGTVADFVNVDNSEYTFNVILAGQGAVTVNIDAAVAVDVADNYNTAAVQFSIVYDSVAPEVVSIIPLILTDADVGSVSVIITFNETMDETTNLIVQAMEITGSPIDVTKFTYSGTTWTGSFTLVDNNEEVMDAYYAVSAAEDSAGNTTVALITRVANNPLDVDTKNATGTVTVDSDLISDDDLVQIVTITYNEPMAVASSPVISFTGSAAVFIAQGDGAWATPTQWIETFNVSDANEEVAAVTVSSSGATDVNGNIEGICISAFFEIDTENVTLTTTTIISDNESNPTVWAKVGDVITLTLTASEPIQTPVVTFKSGGVAINDTTIEYVNTSGDIWTAAYTINSLDSEGIVTFSIVYSDISGDFGIVVTTTTDGSSISFDKTSPTVSFGSIGESGTGMEYTYVNGQTVYFSDLMGSNSTQIEIAVNAADVTGEIDRVVFGAFGADIEIEDIASDYSQTYNITNTDVSGTISVIAYDGPGNVSVVPVTITMVKDTSIPVTAIVVAPMGITYISKDAIPSVFQGDVSDNIGGSGAGANKAVFYLSKISSGTSYYWDGTNWDATTEQWLATTHNVTNSNDISLWSDNVVFPVWEDKETYFVKVKAMDNVGNEFRGSESSFIYDSSVAVISTGVSAVSSLVSDVKTRVSTEAAETRTAITTAKESIGNKISATAAATQTEVTTKATETMTLIGSGDLQIGETLVSTLVREAASRILNQESYVKENDILTIKYKTDTSLTPIISVYDGDNVLRVAEAEMTEAVLGSGIYEYSVEFIWGKNEHTIICKEEIRGTFDGMNINVISTDLEQITADTTTAMGLISGIGTDEIDAASAGIAEANAVINSIMEDIKDSSFLSEDIKGLSEEAIGDFYDSLSVVIEKLKVIGEDQGFRIDEMYDLSEDKAIDLDYIKNKTLEIKAMIELQEEIIEREEDLPVSKSWFESEAQPVLEEQPAFEAQPVLEEQPAFEAQPVLKEQPALEEQR